MNNQVGPVVHPDCRTMQQRGVGNDNQKMRKRWKFVWIVARLVQRMQCAKICVAVGRVKELTLARLMVMFDNGLWQEVPDSH